MLVFMLIAWFAISQIRDRVRVEQLAAQARAEASRQAAVCSELLALRANLISQGESLELGDLVDFGGVAQVTVATYYFGPSSQVPNMQYFYMSSAPGNVGRPSPGVAGLSGKAFYILAKINTLGIPGTIIDLLPATSAPPPTGNMKIVGLVGSQCS